MQINYVFPHPIAKIDVRDKVNNSKIVDTIETLSEGITEESGSDWWDCKVITSFNNDKVNLQFANQHIDFIELVEQYVNDYMVQVGWYTPHLPNRITQIWFNKYVEGHHFQEAHNHGIHEVCAIYYATNDLTPTLFLNPNMHTFHNHYNVNEKTDITKRDFEVQAQPGTLVIFPGYMMHSVPYVRKRETMLQQTSEYELLKNRITIAMNFGKYEKSVLTKTNE